MIKNNKIIVVLPAYNAEKTLIKTYNEIPHEYVDEVILVDDGSSDHSLLYANDALRRFAIDSTVISRVYRQGCFAARVAAIKVARGQYIALADADDVNIEGRFEKQLNFLDDNKNWRYEICGGWAEKIDEDGQSLGLMDYPPQNNKEIIDKIKSDPTCNPFIDPTMMIDKDMLYYGYSSDDDKNLVADMDLWFRSLKSGFIFSNIQEPLIKYRVNPEGNTQSHQTEMIKQHVRVRNEFIKGI